MISCGTEKRSNLDFGVIGSLPFSLSVKPRTSALTFQCFCTLVKNYAGHEDEAKYQKVEGSVELQSQVSVWCGGPFLLPAHHLFFYNLEPNLIPAPTPPAWLQEESFLLQHRWLGPTMSRADTEDPAGTHRPGPWHPVVRGDNAWKR